MAVTVDSVFQSLDSADTPIEMLVLGCGLNEGNAIANALRNSGQAVHVKSASNMDTLKQLLETEPCDLVIVNSDSVTLPYAAAIEEVRDQNPAAAIILVSRQPSELLNFAIEQDIRDLLHADDSARLAFAVRREHSTLLLRHQLVRLQRDLHASENRCNTLIGGSHEAIAYIAEGIHLHANPVYASMFGYASEDELDGLPIMDLIAEDARDAFRKNLRHFDNKHASVEMVKCRTRAGDTVNVRMEFTPAQLDGEDCTQIIAQDESQQRALQARIDELTNRDQHTGLFNRNAFVERLEGLMGAPDKSRHGGLVQVSIANFHDIRDDVGVTAADQVLQLTAETLTRCGEQAHTIARFGEHDFILLMLGDHATTATGEKCLASLKSTDFSSITRIPPAFSVGVTRCQPNADISAHEMLTRSYRATKRASSAESNKLIVYNEQLSPDEDEQERLDTDMVALIDGALENDRFRLHYQPIVSLQGDTRENYSVLLRLMDDNDNELSPEDFLPQAERADRMAELDRWVIRSAISELVRLRSRGNKVNFYIILSRAAIEDDSILLWICDCLREFKAKGAWLVFQFKEHELRSTLKPAHRLMDGLKKINCLIAIDHFQATANSRNLLRHLPIDVVRLSPQFMTNLASDPEHRNKLKALNVELQQLGVKTVATGVEDANSVAALWTIGVNYIQGYFLQEPSSEITLEFES